MRQGLRDLDAVGQSRQGPAIIEGSLEVELPTIWTVEKQSREVNLEDKRSTREYSH